MSECLKVVDTRRSRRDPYAVLAKVEEGLEVTVERKSSRRNEKSNPLRHAATLRRRTCLSIVFIDLRRVRSNS